MSARPRVHTILSLLAEDHAPPHLRPSILLAVDWPTVAEEAPATGDDAVRAADAGNILAFGGKARDHLSATVAALMSCLAARLATVAASLAASSDNTMAAHAAALWGAAAALAGLPATAAQPSELATPGYLAARYLAALATKAADIIHGVIAAGPAEKATLIATALDRVTAYRDALWDLGWDGAENLAEWTERRKTDRERPIAKPLREILGLRPHGSDDVLAVVRNLKASEAKAHADLANLGERFAASELSRKGILSSAVASADECVRLQGDNARLRAQVDRMVAAMREDAPPAKPRPQPGDRVLWAEVEDGCLYFDGGSAGANFLACTGSLWFWLYNADDRDLQRLLGGNGCDGWAVSASDKAGGILVARDLGTDPEAWRRAMREWTANGNRPAPKPFKVPRS